MENIELTTKLKDILKIPTKTNLFYALVQREINKPNQEVNARILLQVLAYHHNKKPVCRCPITHLQKYRDFHTYVDNPFFSKTVKSALLDVFGRIQQVYLALSRFAYIWKIKHATPANTLDLFLNEIDHKKRYIITIYQSKKLFYFTVKDFINIVQRALCNSSGDFTVTCLPPRNPFNKAPFQKSHYYNAYFQMRYEMRMTIPEIFQHWARVGFSLNLIDKKYMTILQRYAIKNFIWNVDKSHTIYIKDIKTMFCEYAVTRCRITIDEDFPMDVLVEKTRGYMHLFYLLRFAGLDETLYDYYETVLIGGLRELVKFNPGFGRKVFVLPHKQKAKPTYAFNSEIVPFETRHL